MGLFSSDRQPKQVRTVPKDNPSNVYNKISKVKKFDYHGKIGVRKGVKTPK